MVRKTRGSGHRHRAADGRLDFSYALGARGSTRRKLAAASGCIIEYVGRLAASRAIAKIEEGARTTSDGS